MTEIINGLYQFTDVLTPMILSVHQYLLMGKEPVLVQTGAIDQAQATITKLKVLLGKKPLKYILISHFESDECGGLSLFLKEYPQAIAVCSETTARQLLGFGITISKQIKIMRPGELLTLNELTFNIIGYPAEMHLWEGLLFYETKNKIFFSSDLMFDLGETHGQVIEDNWISLLDSCGAEKLPNKAMQQKLMKNLAALSPNFVASGHGCCINISSAN